MYIECTSPSPHMQILISLGLVMYLGVHSPVLSEVISGHDDQARLTLLVVVNLMIE